jgi:SAM-dependent methyltransferase
MQKITHIKDFGFKELEIGKIYAKWIFSILKPYIGTSVMEVGCGLGLMINNYSQAKTILATDYNRTYVDLVTKRYRDNNHVYVKQLDITKVSFEQKQFLNHLKINTVLSINVLEHIKEDVKALTGMYEVLPKGGTLLLFVPALPKIYGTIDEEFNHFRRYTKQELTQKVEHVGFKMKRVSYFNIFGIIWWYIMGRILKKRNLPRMTGGLLNIFVPVFQFVESIISPPIGQSLILIAEKK